EYDKAGNLFRLRQPAERYHRFRAAAGFVRGRRHHRRFYEAGVYRVDPDVVAPVLDSHLLGHAAHGELARHVGQVRRSIDGDQPGDRGDIDDGATSRLQHGREHGLHAVEDAELVDIA